MRTLIKLVLAAVVLLVAGFGSLIGYAQYQSSRITLPPLTSGGASVVLAADGKTVLGHIASADAGRQLTVAQIPPLIKQAHMAAEDRGFYTHGAISLPGMAMAIARDAVGLSFSAGGSTITQQVAKKYVGSEKTLQRKIDELPYAYRLEHDYSKDQILAMYVNANYYGRGAYGVEDAAETWFGVRATSLSNMNDPLEVARAAFLAALIQQPSYFDAYKGQPSNLTHAQALWDRTRYVLDGLRALRGIPADQLVRQNVVDAAKRLLPLRLSNTLKNTGSATNGDPYLVSYIHDWLAAWQTQVAKAEDGSLSDAAAASAGLSAADEMLARGGLRIQTSINPDLQSILVAVHKADLRPGPSGMIILDPRNGGVLAMSGGRNYQADPNNYAMYAARPPGSTMKPFVLADAVSQGISVNSVFAAPSYIQVDGPPIWNHTHRDAPGCRLTLSDALAASNNVVYTEAAIGKMASCQNRSQLTPIADYPVTPSSVADLLRQVGADASLVPGRDAPAPLSAQPRLAIGATILLSPLKLAVMASTLADGGVYHKPHLVDSIISATGQTVFQYQGQSQQVLDAKSAYIVDQAMTGVFTHGTAVGDQVGGHPLAGKTGTTDASQGDSWMFAFNADNPDSPQAPAMVCAGWAGSNPNLQGADIGRVCQAFFAEALRGTPAVGFPSADMNAGRLVGLGANTPTASPSSVPSTTVSSEVTTTSAAPTSTPTHHHGPAPTPTPSQTANPVPTGSRSIPPPQQTGPPVSGTATPPGNPPPPARQQAAAT